MEAESLSRESCRDSSAFRDSCRESSGDEILLSLAASGRLGWVPSPGKIRGAVNAQGSISSYCKVLAFQMNQIRLFILSMGLGGRVPSGATLAAVAQLLSCPWCCWQWQL